MLRFDKVTYLSLLFKFILFERLSDSLWGLDVLLFPELINIEFILFYNFIEFIILLYNFLAISFAQHKEYIICLISFSNFSGVLPAFTWANAIGNLWSICLGVNILSCLWLKTLSKRLLIPFHCFPFGNFPLSKALRSFCFPLRNIIAFLKVIAFFSFLNDSFGFVDSLKISTSSFNIISCSNALYKDKSLL